MEAEALKHDYQRQLEREEAKAKADAAAYCQARLEEEWDKIACEYLADLWGYLEKHGTDDATRKRLREITLNRWSNYFIRELFWNRTSALNSVGDSGFVFDSAFSDSAKAFSAYGFRRKTLIRTYYDWY